MCTRFLLLRLTVLAATTSLVGLAAAQATVPLAETLVGDARGDYQDGKRLYERGDFSGALQKFESAFRTSSDPRLKWNEAACEMGMRHYARAIALVRRYLDSRSPLVTPEAARNARDFLAAAELLTAHVEVQASERDAIVSVDDETVGAIPLPADFRVDLGTHRIVVRKSGFSEYATALTIVNPADVHVSAALQRMVRAQGHLSVRAGSRDAIAIDGEVVGTGAWEGALRNGSHTVRVSAPDARPFESTVVVEGEQTRALDIALQRLPHSTRIPTWGWIAVGVVLTAGAITGGYFLSRPAETAVPFRGSAGDVRLP